MITIQDRQKKKIAAFLWSLAFFTAVLNLVFILFINSQVHKIITKILFIGKLHSQTLELTNTSNLIPILIQKYVFTMNAQYLQQYWHQLEMGQIIEKVVTELSQYPAFTAVVNEIKNNDDKLRAQEIGVLKLLFSAYHIPEEVIHPKIAAYRLSGAQEVLSDVQKLQLAKHILFDLNHEKLLQKIQDSIHNLQILIDEQKQTALEGGKKITKFFAALLMAFSIFLIIIISTILWLRLIDK